MPRSKKNIGPDALADAIASGDLEAIKAAYAASQTAVIETPKPKVKPKPKKQPKVAKAPKNKSPTIIVPTTPNALTAVKIAPLPYAKDGNNITKGQTPRMPFANIHDPKARKQAEEFAEKSPPKYYRDESIPLMVKCTKCGKEMNYNQEYPAGKLGDKDRDHIMLCNKCRGAAAS